MLSTAKNKPTKLLSASLLSDEQNKAIDRLYNYNETFLVANMGAGKTVTGLTAINDLIKDGVLKKVLIVS